MPVFSTKSRERLARVHPDLVRVMELVVKNYDCVILEGWRSHEDQQKVYDQGKSEAKPGQSWHNGWRKNGNFWVPDPQGISLAVDVAPYPIVWEDIPRFHRFAHYVLGVADALGTPLRWGGDWNKNWNMKDQKLHDCPHFELAGAFRSAL